MKKEPGTVGWPTKTLAINTIDLLPRDGRKVEGRKADREKDRKKIETRGREQGQSISQKCAALFSGV